MSLSTLEFRVLSWVFVHFKWRLFTTYLAVSSPSKWRDSYSHKHLLIFFCFCFLFYAPFFHTFIHLCLAFFIHLKHSYIIWRHFKCLGFGHITANCPTKRTMMVKGGLEVVTTLINLLGIPLLPLQKPLVKMNVRYLVKVTY